MARVYLDESVLYFRRGEAQAVLDPGAELAVTMLESDGHDVVVVGDEVAARRLGFWISRLPHTAAPCPSDAGRERAWYIVGNRACCGSRVSGLTTILVGGGARDRTVGGRCDAEVADLFRAALSVIASDAKPAVVSSAGDAQAQEEIGG